MTSKSPNQGFHFFVSGFIFVCVMAVIIANSPFEIGEVVREKIHEKVHSHVQNPFDLEEDDERVELETIEWK